MHVNRFSIRWCQVSDCEAVKEFWSINLLILLIIYILGKSKHLILDPVLWSSEFLPLQRNLSRRALHLQELIQVSPLRVYLFDCFNWTFKCTQVTWKTNKDYTETGVSWHHEGLNWGTFETPRTITALYYLEDLRGALIWDPIMSRDASMYIFLVGRWIDKIGIGFIGYRCIQAAVYIVINLFK